ncbi:MAG TPA: xanthine dehydrogenase family protein molybdopterin-binding subunit [Dehalococcoidia bacterium]|nr:xanthine dehydrogenase family protein molybdopterin-binding subunit [Dehalococcoidia bacterium]HIL30702.1 xanthine dehydrogenase family protein molybdopterin-binding subunit [Dehalococcoidia bacterium]
MAENIVLSNSEYKVVGTRPIRHDGTDKVTGRAKYGTDFQTAGMYYGKVLRSPHAHAIIKSIDASKALALPGVEAVITGKDMPGANNPDASRGTQMASDNLLARTKVLYKGHPVAAVAAANQHVAEAALDLIKVEYEVLPAVMTVQQAMAKDAPLLHENLTTTELGERTDKKSNVATHVQFTQGDIEKGFAAADVIVELEFGNETVHQGYIEPQTASAIWNENGEVTVWTSTQGAFTARDALAPLLDVPVSKIKVVPMEIGGGFGGKIPVYLEPLAALLSKKTGRTVKMTMTRAETFESTGPTSGTTMKVKMGATHAGKITAAQADLTFEAGGFPGSMVSAGAQCIFAPYDIENMQADGYDVLVNKPKVAPYRAPAAPNVAFAGEQVVDALALKLNIDPIEFRLMNAAKEGTRRVDGPIFPVIGHVECLEAAKDSAQYKTELKGSYQGRGVASGFWFNIGFQSSCSIAVNADGTISLVEGSTDIGGTRASIAMQAAEVLGIAAEDVHPTVGDTDSVGYTAMTGGSRTTFATGWAAYETAQDIKKQMIERAASIWDVSADDVEMEDGVFKHKSDGDLKLTFKELAGQLGGSGGGISSQSTVDPKGAGGAFGTHVVDLEVDPETGKVTILDYTIVQDAGKAIHPSYVEGQMQGGVVQGIGWALNEEYFYDGEGRMENSSFLDYRMPTSLDTTMINTIIVEVANPGHPYGVRGVGEVPIVPPMAAIANAIARATGLRMGRLPMSPGAILEALWAKDGEPTGIQAAD